MRIIDALKCELDNRVYEENPERGGAPGRVYYGGPGALEEYEASRAAK